MSPQRPRASAGRVATAVAVVAFAGAALMLQASCARSVDSDVPSDPSLVASGAKNPVALAVCVATECPAPWATCPDVPGLCTTNTNNDVLHCGSCDGECPAQPASHHATSLCANGKCAIACEELSADCNHDPSDGCEVLTADDPNNCGGCGIVCKTGADAGGAGDAGDAGDASSASTGGDPAICWKGACGCPKGFTQCGNECKNLEADDLNCGACDKKCVPPKSDDPEWKCGPLIQPPSTEWSCGGGCHISCKALFGDCNFDMCADGCEIDEHSDPNNCGACGHKCDANQNCVDGTCMCPAGTVLCDDRCVDVNVDPDNCGACGNGCLGAEGDGANGSPTCTKGRCGYVCYAGYANCNSRLDDGCESKVSSDPLNCGACNVKCDVAQGQPCVEGACLTKPCGPAAGTF